MTLEQAKQLVGEMVKIKQRHGDIHKVPGVIEAIEGGKVLVKPRGHGRLERFDPEMLQPWVSRLSEAARKALPEMGMAGMTHGIPESLGKAVIEVVPDEPEDWYVVDPGSRLLWTGATWTADPDQARAFRAWKPANDERMKLKTLNLLTMSETEMLDLMTAPPPTPALPDCHPDSFGGSDFPDDVVMAMTSAPAKVSPAAPPPPAPVSQPAKRSVLDLASRLEELQDADKAACQRILALRRELSDLDAQSAKRSVEMRAIASELREFHAQLGRMLAEIGGAA